MADEQLRLVASLKDNASAGVRAIGKQLKTVRVEPGMMQAQKWVRTFNDDVANFRAQGARVGGILTSMGVGGLAAAGSIGAMVAQFKALSDRVLDVKELGREIGVTTDELRAMTRAGQHFGIDPAKMDGALKRLAGMMPILRRGGNNELTQALDRSPELIAKIRAEADDTGAVFRDVLGYINKLQNPQDRIKFFEQALGDGDLERLNSEGTGGFQKQLDAARKSIEPITKEAEAQAQALREAMLDFNASIEKLELKVAPAVFAGLTQAANDFRQAFGVIEKAYEWYQANRDHPIEAAGKSFADSVHEIGRENDRRHPDGMIFNAPGALDRVLETVVGKKALGRDEFAPAKDDADRASRLAAMQRELDAAAAKLAADHNPVSFATRQADTIARVRELRDAIGALGGPAALPQTAPIPQPRPPAPAFHVPSRYDAEARARRGRDDLDGFVVGSLGRDVLHLQGTLRTAAAKAKDDGIHPAAYHPAGLIGSPAGNDPASIIEAGTKAGVIAAFRELSGLAGPDGSTARNGLMPVSYGGGGGSGGGNPALGGGSFGGHGGSYGNPSKSLLDFIAKSEGGGYNVSWGNGRFLPGGHEQNLTGKSLNEILALGDVMRRQPGARNSSAMGRYQITGSTLRDLMKRMGLSGSEKYDEAMQDRLASKLISDEGPRALGRWEELKRGGRMSTALGLLQSGQIASQPETSGPKGAYPDWMDPKSRREMAGINAPLARDLLAASQATGTHFRILQGLRTGAEADANARRGVGVRNSQHLYGAAADIKLTDADGRDLDRNSAAYENFANAMESHSRSLGGHGRWLGHVPGWSWDRAHFDQGIGYGQSHARDPYGVGGPTEADKRDGSFEIFRGPDNPFLKAAKPMSDAAEQLRGAAGLQSQAARAVAKVPDWHDASRPDLGAMKRQADRVDREKDRIEGGVDAHIHLHDGRRISTSTATRGAVRDARITVRTAPQRTATV